MTYISFSRAALYLVTAILFALQDYKPKNKDVLNNDMLYLLILLTKNNTMCLNLELRVKVFKGEK